MDGPRSAFYLYLAMHYMLIKISFLNHSKSSGDNQVPGAQRATVQSPLRNVPRAPAVSARRAVGATNTLKKKHRIDHPPVDLPELVMWLLKALGGTTTDGKLQLLFL